MKDKQLVLDVVAAFGSRSELANICGKPVTPSHVYNWVKRDERIPPKHVLKIEAALIAKGVTDIDRYKMAPEVFQLDQVS